MSGFEWDNDIDVTLEKIDEIATAILQMLNTLHLLNALKDEDVPFAQNVHDAVERFDKPELRSMLVSLLYD